MSNDAEYTARCLKHYPKRRIEAKLETEDDVKKELDEADQVYLYGNYLPNWHSVPRLFSARSFPYIF